MTTEKERSPDDRSESDRLIALSEDQAHRLAYEELRRLARRQLGKEYHRGSLQTTVLVNEAYLRLRRSSLPAGMHKSDLQAVAVRAMQQFLLDRGRSRNAKKRGEGQDALPLDELQVAIGGSTFSAVLVAQLLERFERTGHARKAKVVLLRCYAGFTETEIGRQLGVERRTVSRDWQFAQAWLCRELNSSGAGDS